MLRDVVTKRMVMILACADERPRGGLFCCCGRVLSNRMVGLFCLVFWSAGCTSSGAPAVSGLLEIHSAVKVGDLARVKSLVGGDRRVLEAKEYGSGRTPLLTAVLKKEVAVVRYLLSEGANPDAANGLGQTSLHLSIAQGQLEVTKLLLAHGADVNWKSKAGMTPLGTAVIIAPLELIEMLLESGANPSQSEESGLIPTPIHVASYLGHFDVFEVLCKRLAKVDVAWKGKTLLHAAIQGGGVRARGVTVREMTTKGLRSLGVTEKRADLIGRLLAERGRGFGKDQTKIVKYLIGRGVDVDGADKRGWTALNMAAKHGNAGVVKVLLEAGARSDIRDGQGFVPLHSAVESGHEAVVRLLLKHGAAVNATVPDGRSAMHMAAGGGYVGILRALSANKGDVATREKQNGFTPLQVSSMRGDYLAAKVLVEAGADVRSQSRNQDTTLMVLSSGAGMSRITPQLLKKFPRPPSGEYLKVGKLLLKHGADARAKNKDGFTALHFSAIANHEGLAKLVIGAGAALDGRDHEGRTALMFAAHYGLERMCAVLLEAGADAGIRDKRMKMARDYAVEKNRFGVIRLLRDHRVKKEGR